MTNNYKIARFATLLLVFFAFLTQSAKAQLEPFAQASGFISTTNGWVAHGGTGTPPNFTQQISIVAGSLAYTGLATPTGNKITTVAGNTEDINRALTAPITTTGYFSAILNVSNTTGLSTTGEYFMHFAGGAGASVGTTFMARLFIKTGTAPNTFTLGILNMSGTGNAVSYVTTDYPTGTSIFVVVKYDRTLTTGGTASLFVNPIPGAVEPTANLVNATGTSASATSLSSICIRQVGTATAGTGNIEIDELRGGTDWASVTPASTPTSAPGIAITQSATAIPSNNTPAFAMGSVATNTNLDVIFTITNAGTAPLTLTSTSISGVGYIIPLPPTSPVNNIAPNNITTFTVRFSSTTAVAGALGTVTIANNAGADYVLNLSATATTAPVGGTDYEPFNQASGFISTTNGWVAHSGTGTSPNFTQQISIVAGSLAYTGLATPTGNKISIVAGNTEDINRVISTPITITAYYSALINVPNTTGLAINTANGDYFLALGGTSGSATISILTGRFFIRQGSVANTFNLGVLNNSGGTAPNPIPTYSTTDYAVGATYFIAVKYNFATNTASLWINPATGLTTEPTTTLNSNAGTNVAPPNLVSIVIRQGGSHTTTPPSTTGNVEIDEIRVGDNWASVTPAGPAFPSLSATPATVAFGNIVVGATIAPLSYSLSGANLTNPVTITASAAFQIATSATGTFGTTLTFTVAQMATPQTIFIRPTSTATLGALAGNITHASTGVTTAPSVAVSGAITTPTTSTAVILAVLTVADFGTVATGLVSTVKTFAVQGTNLTADLVVTAPANFQVSKDGITFSTSVSFTAAEVAPINGKDVSVRFAPTTGGAGGGRAGNIVSSSTGAVSKNTAVTGTEINPATALDNSFAKETVIYPNPAQTSFQIKLPTNSKNYVVEVVDVTGKVILTKKSDEVISIENLQKGFYFVRFSNTERTFTKKISIN